MRTKRDDRDSKEACILEATYLGSSGFRIPGLPIFLVANPFLCPEALDILRVFFA